MILDSIVPFAGVHRNPPAPRHRSVDIGIEAYAANRAEIAPIGSSAKSTPVSSG